ncbi:MAG TPA: SUF system NifU family Fe-S cluster assembly protein [Acidimicrobiales bacterium]|nr:SUF system NifU family Fe-S cluster assembly protein [Acidimicrobiales bacterium]
MPGLEDLYREIILDHYRNPRNRGELPVPPAVRNEGFNPLCGDEIVVYLDVNNGTISDIRVAGQGCSISQSSASMMTSLVKGKSISEARELISKFKTMMSIHESALDTSGDSRSSANESGGLPAGDASNSSTSETERALNEDELASLGDLAALQGVVKFPVRIKCATLSWNTLAQGLDEASSSI